jgi:ribosomal subunit interface protein
MKLNVIGKNLDLTASLKTYAGNKLLPLAKFLKGFEKMGEAFMRLEVARITRRHRRGDVFRAAADLRLPGRVLRAESTSVDARAAVDRVKDELRKEIEKYRTRLLAARRRR